MLTQPRYVPAGKFSCSPRPIYECNVHAWQATQPALKPLQTACIAIILLDIHLCYIAFTYHFSRILFSYIYIRIISFLGYSKRSFFAVLPLIGCHLSQVYHTVSLFSVIELLSPPAMG
jgi:hypothetical protein